jgi:hypothetical protein
MGSLLAMEIPSSMPAILEAHSIQAIKTHSMQATDQATLLLSSRTRAEVFVS